MNSNGAVSQEAKSAYAWRDRLPDTKDKFFLSKQWPLQLEGSTPLYCKQGSTRAR